MPRRPQNNSPIRDNNLWDCLNSSFIAKENETARDDIGFEQPCGITVVAPVAQTESKRTSEHPPKQVDHQVIVDNLDKASIQTWIEHNSIDQPKLDERLRLKVLVIHQIIRGDTLRPPLDAGACKLSRRYLQTHFGCPDAALEKASQNGSWAWNFPTYQRSATAVISCAGLGAIDINIIWMRKEKSNVTWAIAVFKRPVFDARDRFETDLKRLGRYCELPGFLPFIAVTASIQSIERRMEGRLRSIFQADVRLERFPNGRVAEELYFESNTNARNIGVVQRCAGVMIRTLDACTKAMASATRSGDSSLKEKAAELTTAIHYQKQSLHAIIEDCQENRAQTARQIECILGFMAQAQTRLSIEIAENQAKLAEASRREQMISVEIARSSQQIAADTRRDGSSMKTLAVVTLVYLPCTTISSILAMPLFDWDAETGAVVNPRIWVFCVLAIPLTFITIGLWQIWLKMRGDRKSKAQVGGAIVEEAKPYILVVCLQSEHCSSNFLCDLVVQVDSISSSSTNYQPGGQLITSGRSLALSLLLIQAVFLNMSVGDEYPLRMHVLSTTTIGPTVFVI
ncbi:hypothetical protein B0A52_06640 [Exophiala mesophila]|uniref:Uncharacterized protein n=1 Tax=Exophiala mesophila TaxID=212818 RepID=A0A438N1M0_EXOME|nr:hypothetical protein B0A52_06640 [Exophiala mesophila]